MFKVLERLAQLVEQQGTTALYVIGSIPVPFVEIISARKI
jgi:hypothetical protein